MMLAMHVVYFHWQEIVGGAGECRRPGFGGGEKVVGFDVRDQRPDTRRCY